MYLQIAHRSPRMIAAMNCVSTFVTSSPFPTFKLVGKGALQRGLGYMRTTAIPDASTYDVLGETVGNEKLDESSLGVCRLEARHPALRGFF